MGTPTLAKGTDDALLGSRAFIKAMFSAGVGVRSYDSANSWRKSAWVYPGYVSAISRMNSATRLSGSANGAVKGDTPD